MKRSAFITAAAAVGLAFTGCTAQQRHLAEQAIADTPTDTTVAVAEAVEATVYVVNTITATVDCGSFTVRINGYDEGTLVEMGIAYETAVDDDQSFQFATTPGGDAGVLGVVTADAFSATVDINGVRVFEQFVDCTV